MLIGGVTARVGCLVMLTSSVAPDHTCPDALQACHFLSYRKPALFSLANRIECTLGKRLGYATACAFRILYCRQRLLQVGNQILWVLHTNREADHGVRDAHFYAFFGVNIGMGHGGGMFD